MNVLRLVPPQGDPIVVSQDRAIVGRDGVCDVHLRDVSVSRQHAEIRRSGEDWILTDLNSGNGVRIDGQKMTRATLAPGQEIQLGNVLLRVEIEPGDDGATMIFGRETGEMARTMIQRHPPRHPDAALGKLRGEPVPTGPARLARTGDPVEATRLRLSRVLLVLVLLTLAGVAARMALRQAPRGTEPAPLETPSSPAPIAGEGTPKAPELATPTPGPGPGSAPTVIPVNTPTVPRQGVLLITTDERARLSIDGVRQAPLSAGEMRRIEVLPGEHLLTFDAGDGEKERVVRAAANEQTVVRFSGSTTVAATATAAPTPTPSPAPIERGLRDEGLGSGIAATERGDFYRALLVLKDATRRLDDDPAQVQDLALANAYLAWTYHALDRMGEAVVAAQKATRLDPSISARLESFPPPVRALFNPAR